MSQLKKLETGIAAAGLEVPLEAQKKLISYLDLLEKWNKVHNLTAVRDAGEMVTLHLLDSLAVLPYIHAKSLLDVGSGAGLPGVVLAICLPDLQVSTIDSVQKKTSFMRQVKAELQLNNLQVISGRVEQFKSDAKFDVIISRAFSDLCLFVKLTRHLLSARGQWLAMKGVYPASELDALKLKTGLVPDAVQELHVPNLGAKRHLVILPNQLM
jgi:16S rRNA (guanine527-N7)-methyltransferase